MLEIKDLTVSFKSREKKFHAVNNFSLSVKEGELIGIAGESGSGKSVSMLAIMGLIQSVGKVEAAKMEFNGKNMLTMSDKERRKTIGKDISMIFQDPMTSLNPCFTVGSQIMEMLKTHGYGGNTKKQRQQYIFDLLDQVGIPEPEKRYTSYPHQLSGGMNQRVLIAMAISCKPRLLIADEPTTALDVTIQAQIIDLLLQLQVKHNMALILITHDLGLVYNTTKKAVIMYASEVIEQGLLPAAFKNPKHPYTKALIETLPENTINEKYLPTLPGMVPSMYHQPSGCYFSPRCKYADDICKQQHPELIKQDINTSVRCFKPLDTL